MPVLFYHSLDTNKLFKKSIRVADHDSNGTLYVNPGWKIGETRVFIILCFFQGNGLITSFQG